MKLLERVVEDTLAMPVAHTLAVDLGGFEAAVDALDAIQVDVPCPIIDNFVDQRTESGRRRLDVEAGNRTMDGATAAMYVRSRHGRSDWSRARRQQAVLLAMKHRATTLGGLARLPRLLEGLTQLLRTDMTRRELLVLAKRALEVKPDQIHGLVIGHAHTVSYRTADGKAVLLPNQAAIDSALRQLFSQDTPGMLPKSARCAPADAALRRKPTSARIGSPAS
jgi:LCP family protein required for cell wall assembly